MKKFSKLFILLLVVGLLFAVAPTAQAQAQTVSTWDGIYPTSAPGDLPAVVGGVQEVNTAAQFAWLASQTDMFPAGVTTVKLMVDINLANLPWTPSGGLASGSAATGNIFDGNGHTISNLHVVSSEAAGLFVGANGGEPIVQNLVIEGAYIEATPTATNIEANAAVVAVGIDGGFSFSNVTVRNATVKGTKYVAGISAYSSGLDADGGYYTNCTVENTLLEVQEMWNTAEAKVEKPHVGGIVGLMNKGTFSGNSATNLTITVLPVNGEPVATERVGALIGTAQAPVLVGTYDISNVMYNTSPYTKIIGLDNRTYKVVNATQMLGYTTIQAAVTASADGDVINVAAGTYNEENITITKGISLLGAGAATTSIAPTAVTNNSTLIVSNPSGNVKIDGFNFVMQPKPNYGSAVVVTGTVIAIDSATVTISNNIITGSNDGSKSDYGFYGQNNNAKVIIENNTINKTGDNPICFEGQAGSTTVLNNVIRIVDSPDYDPYFSMAYAGLTVSTPQIVEGNTFYLDHAGSGYASAITFNTAVLNDWNSTTTDNGHYTNIQIKNNIINTNGPEARGINLADRSAGGGLGTITGAVITGNRIIGENLTDVNTYGIAVKGDVQGAQILSNTINNVISGIRIIPGNGTTPICPSGSIITSNQITSVGVSVNNECTSGSVDVSSNWWGSTADPQAGFVGTVVYSPWCANAACTEFLPAMATISPVAPVVCGNTTTTTIDVNISGIPASMVAQGYQLTLHFDPTKTSIASEDDITQGGFLPLSTGFTVRTIDNVNGTVVIASTIFGTATNNPALPLAKITLTHLGFPGDIDLSLSDVLLSDVDGQPIPADVSTEPVTLTLQPAVLNTTKDPDLGYCSLAAAVLDAAAGDNLELQADIAIPETVIIDKELTLDLNGKVATYSPTDNSYALTVNGTSAALEVKDTSLTGTGKILVVDGDTDTITEGRGISVISGSLTLTSGTIQAPYAGVYVRPGASMVMNGGTIGGTVDPLYGIVILGTGSSLDINGGAIEATYFAVSGNGTAGYGDTTITIDGGSLTSTTAAAIYHPQDGDLTITAGIISGINGIEMKAGNLVVSGGTILGTGPYADPTANDNGSVETGDAILLNGRDAYTGDITVNITGGTITSSNAYALRDYKAADQDLKTSSVAISGGTFTGGSGKEAVTFSPELRAAELAEPETANLALTGGLYNTDPDHFVFVPYGTVLDGTMYKIVGISLNVNSFYYWKEGTTFLGVKADIETTNFLFSEATSVTVQTYSGTVGAYTLQQTNTLKVPANWSQNSLTSPFNIFGTYVSSSWETTRQSEYGQHVAPTRVLVTVVLPSGTLTAEAVISAGGPFTYADIVPSIAISDFGYMASSGVRGLSAGVAATNFNFNMATAIELKLYAGTQLLQTNTAPAGSPLFANFYTAISGPFDIFGTFDYTTDYWPGTGPTPNWTNLRGVPEYGQTVVPTKVVATVTLPGGVILTAERSDPDNPRTDILPGVNGLITLQGILAPKAGVPVRLTSGAVVRNTTSTALSDINYGFTGVETLTYTFTTHQPRYLNVTDASLKSFLVNGDKTLTALRLFGGDVNQDNAITVSDASDVGTAWGWTSNPEANINYDGIVNIQDLALVGGNFGMISATAYAWWSPLP